MRCFYFAAILCVALLLTQHAFAQASSAPYECNLSGGVGANLLGCPNNPDPTGKLTTKATIGVVVGNINAASITCSTLSASVPPYCAARGDSAIAASPIDAWGTCRWVDNVGANAIFVPFRTSSEWQSFLAATTSPHSIAGITVTPCAEPQSETHTTSPVSTIPTYDNTCAGVTKNDGTIAVPNVYGRTGVYGSAMTSLYPASPALQNFTCHGGATNITSQLQWYAGNINWTSKFIYSPDLVLTAAPSSTTSAPVNAGTHVALSWGTDSTATSCKASDNNLASDTWNVNTWTPTTNNPLPTVSHTASVTVTPTVTTIYTVSCTGTNNLISTANVTVYVVQPVNGVCGTTVNGQTLASAPSGSELCNSGTPTAVTGSGPWSWGCQGSSGGTNGTCTANMTAPICPIATVGLNPSDTNDNPIINGNTYLTFPGITNQTDVPATSTSQTGVSTFTVWGTIDGYTGYVTSSIGTWSASYFNNACQASIYYGMNSSTLTYYQSGGNQTASGPGMTDFSFGGFDTSYAPLNHFVLCIATQYARQNLKGYANCTPSSVSGEAWSPLKVNLAGGDAKLNSSNPTTFLLTLQNGHILEGHGTGGLNDDEGWLMVKRSKDPFVLSNGMLNANDWFGDRDHRSLNGYTDLAETFGAFVFRDESGQRYIPLHALMDAEKNQMAAEAEASNDIKITNPSFDLRIVDAANQEHFASDYFDRIYVDYRSVVEGDGPDGKSGDNMILERGMVHTLDGENHGAVDQWFKLDLPADYSTPKGRQTQSKVWPTTSTPTQ